ncbi:hypothetical protein F4861DRAFT_127188 [Xylaria intraflava]|nr:hypothetical protein F4861DRAFT_127188 [Xylaria intraflava]
MRGFVEIPPPSFFFFFFWVFGRSLWSGRGKRALVASLGKWIGDDRCPFLSRHHFHPPPLFFLSCCASGSCPLCAAGEGFRERGFACYSPVPHSLASPFRPVYLRSFFFFLFLCGCFGRGWRQMA